MPNEALKILLVDDDPLVAASLARALSGHRPVVDTHAQAAYRRLRAGEWFDAVVCDAAMPVISGLRLLATARELLDSPVFVLMSAGDIVASEADAILHKPFAADRLLDLLAILAGRRAGQRTLRLPRVRLP